MSNNVKLFKIYYSANDYWKRHSAIITKLADKAKVSESVTKDWLQKQALWQIYLSPPKYIPKPHWVVDKPNKIHQAVVIDVAGRYKDAEPLTSRSKSFQQYLFSKTKVARKNDS